MIAERYLLPVGRSAEYNDLCGLHRFNCVHCGPFSMKGRVFILFRDLSARLLYVQALYGPG